MPPNTTGGPTLAGGGEDVIQDIWKGIAQGKWGVVAFNDALGRQRHDTGRHLPQLRHRQPLPEELVRPAIRTATRKRTTTMSRYKGGMPANNGNVASVPGSYSGSIKDNYAINWVGLPTSGGPTMLC